MKILIMSDNHGDVLTIEQVMEQHKDIRYIFHCGDYCSSHKNDYLIRVQGNCDYEEISHEKIVELDGLRFLIVHGHLFSRVNLVTQLAQYAKTKNCDVVCFGHIHRRVFEVIDGITLINPGSLSYNYDGTTPGYAIFDTSTKHVEFMYV